MTHIILPRRQKDYMAHIIFPEGVALNQSDNRFVINAYSIQISNTVATVPVHCKNYCVNFTQELV